MRDSFAIAMAMLVATALIGGVAGTAAGAQPTISTDGPAAGAQPAVGAAAAGAGPAQTDGACGFPYNATDATGETITLEERPDRITTINPSAAQTLWELGAQERVVGVSQFAFYLDGAEERANVSAEFGASVERVVDTEPDLVLAPNSSAADVEPLREQGLTVYHFPTATSIDDIAEKTETIGRLVGACEAASETNAEMYDAVEAAEERTSGVERPTALYPLGGGYVAANNTFIDAIMTASGTDNAAAEHEAYPQLSDEVILQTDPELIIVTDPEAAILDQEPYASTTAGAEDSYVVMNVNYLNQPAPRSVIESTTTLSNAVVELRSDGSESTDGAEGGSSDGDGSDGGDSSGDGSGDGDASDGDGSTTGDSTGSDDESAGDTGAESPGFGVVAAALALLATGLLARRE
ncbi:PGF-CTERM sorting domain-containing protein [Halorubrum sp. Atlit-8R]|uniref:PGF-CTERM-anchored ABC transporter substrate-binding protein n=1 Tax=unclassified Halorubrum TaxID=2642239 RepID=UPI000EF291E8|nr:MULTISPECIES: PGF-CTERM-anchored ABC transporter substrate-binding protein [unclassified Halorubrum]RLM71055.1 PGF-CTERM sorting domain-containing protein [Halorubrum sp. Atlit-9R]RLM71923.1 PGF-CTERM sorting domain-containing protein [Halorubrum sp. Atlit-9R]RLM82792.1 PGF-CTERM sorting domain-containing protein [Halorubrum sp. Atlit-8R]